ncbi:hypothetical protein JY97_08255 [Alkalispirochaeta odontotermitis]|nr:hypothetical protein JY97_08255 [Alkalispirochaeta odontotermitis]CAB1073884.1 hypothetical protein D1AOALGA4SA_1989 [Olavius algarvensis Delta 1 endosymbiont]
MRVLFITHAYPNYVPDLLLHGLRKLLGPEVVDYPKKDCVYDGVLGLGVCPDDQRCPGWFPADDGQIDREDIPRKVATGYFDMVVCDVRALGFLQKSFANWPSSLVIIDGEDSPAGIPVGKYIICRRETDGSDYCIPLPMALPEEIFNWIASYDDLPKQYSIGFLGSTPDGWRRQIIETIAKHYRNALLQTSIVPSGPEPSPAGRLGRDDYYRNLQKCRIVLSLPGSGYDTFRFWENSACNSVHLAAQMPLFIPDDFQEQRHLFKFAAMDQFTHIVDRMLDDRIKSDAVVNEARRHLITFHMTTNRAKYFLAKVKNAFMA